MGQRRERKRGCVRHPEGLEAERRPLERTATAPGQADARRPPGIWLSSPVSTGNGDLIGIVGRRQWPLRPRHASMPARPASPKGRPGVATAPVQRSTSMTGEWRARFAITIIEKTPVSEPPDSASIFARPPVRRQGFSRVRTVRNAAKFVSRRPTTHGRGMATLVIAEQPAQGRRHYGPALGESTRSCGHIS